MISMVFISKCEWGSECMCVHAFSSLMDYLMYH